MNDYGLREILTYALIYLEYMYNPKESNSEDFFCSLEHLLPNKETYHSSIGAIKRPTKQTMDKQGARCNLFTVLTNLAYKFDGILCFGFDYNRNLVVGHLEYGATF